MSTSTREQGPTGGRDHRNPWPASIGMGGRLRSESPADFVGMRMTGALSVADARKLAPDMRTTESELVGTAKRDGTFEMQCYIGNVTPHAVKLTFEYGTAENAPKLTAQEHAALRERNRQLLSARPAHVPPQQHAVVEPASAPKQTPPPAVPTPPRDIGAEIPRSEIKPGKDWLRS